MLKLEIKETDMHVKMEGRTPELLVEMTIGVIGFADRLAKHDVNRRNAILRRLVGQLEKVQTMSTEELFETEKEKSGE